MTKFISKYPRPPKPVRRVPPGRKPIIGPLAQAMLAMMPPTVDEEGVPVEDSIPYHRENPQGAYQARRRLLKSKLIDEDFKICVHPDPSGEAKWRIWRTA